MKKSGRTISIQELETITENNTDYNKEVAPIDEPFIHKENKLNKLGEEKREQKILNGHYSSPGVFCYEPDTPKSSSLIKLGPLFAPDDQNPQPQDKPNRKVKFAPTNVLREPKQILEEASQASISEEPIAQVSQIDRKIDKIISSVEENIVKSGNMAAQYLSSILEKTNKAATNAFNATSAQTPAKRKQQKLSSAKIFR